MVRYSGTRHRTSRATSLVKVIHVLLASVSGSNEPLWFALLGFCIDRFHGAPSMAMRLTIPFLYFQRSWIREIYGCLSIIEDWSSGNPLTLFLSSNMLLRFRYTTTRCLLLGSCCSHRIAPARTPTAFDKRFIVLPGLQDVANVEVLHGPVCLFAADCAKTILTL